MSFTSPHLDRLSELVPQDKAKAAIDLADRVRQAADAAVLAAAPLLAEFEQANTDASEALVRRGQEINLLNDTIEQLRAEVSALKAQAQAQKDTIEQLRAEVSALKAQAQAQKDSQPAPKRAG